MKRRQLGQNGPHISEVGIGAMSFTNFYGNTDESRSHSVLHEALNIGINHIDTSNVYGMGKSETVIGNFLSKQGAQKHDLFVIATKAAITRDKKTGERSFNNTKGHLTAELEGSLKRLGLDCIDLFYIHRRDPSIQIEEVTETLADLVRVGKIKQFGFSEIAPSSLRRAQKIHPIAAIQSEYSLAVRSPELGLVQTTSELNASLVAFSPVARGLLTDTPHTQKAIEKMDFLKQIPRFQPPNLATNIKITNQFRTLAAEMGVASASLAIAWVLRQSSNVITIPGTRSPQHLIELAKGSEINLSESDMLNIEKTLPIGWAHGDRYSVDQWVGPERYC